MYALFEKSNQMTCFEWAISVAIGTNHKYENLEYYAIGFYDGLKQTLWSLENEITREYYFGDIMGSPRDFKNDQDYKNGWDVGSAVAQQYESEEYPKDLFKSEIAKAFFIEKSAPKGALSSHSI